MTELFAVTFVKIWHWLTLSIGVTFLIGTIDFYIFETHYLFDKTGLLGELPGVIWFFGGVTTALVLGFISLIAMAAEQLIFTRQESYLEAIYKELKKLNEKNTNESL